MLIIDNIVSYPVRGILAVFLEIYKATAADLVDQADGIRAELSRNYQMLSNGTMSEEDFDRVEGELLDRLDAIDAIIESNEDEDSQDDEEATDDDEVSDDDDEDSDDELSNE